jgi:hypothetical protein
MMMVMSAVRESRHACRDGDQRDSQRETDLGTAHDLFSPFMTMNKSIKARNPFW